MTYAYLRVSTREQNEERQLLAIEGLGIPEKNVYLDKESGKNFLRSGYVKLEEAAKEAGISPSTFYRRAKETKLSTLRR